MAKVSKAVKKLTDQQFLDEELRRGFTFMNKGYAANMNKLAVYIDTVLNARKTFEIGAGTGTLLKLMFDRGINAWGFDPSKPHKDWWDKHVPDLKYRYHQGEEIHIAEHFDTVVSIEVFEHLTDEQIAAYLFDCAANCDYFVFSSTSIHDTPEFDIQWGHINVKPQSEWIEIFADYGFELYQEINFPTEWTKVFKSKI